MRRERKRDAQARPRFITILLLAAGLSSLPAFSASAHIASLGRLFEFLGVRGRLQGVEEQSVVFNELRSLLEMGGLRSSQARALLLGDEENLARGLIQIERRLLRQTSTYHRTRSLSHLQLEFPSLAPAWISADHASSLPRLARMRGNPIQDWVNQTHRSLVQRHGLRSARRLFRRRLSHTTLFDSLFSAPRADHLLARLSMELLESAPAVRHARTRQLTRLIREQQGFGPIRVPQHGVPSNLAKLLRESRVPFEYLMADYPQTEVFFRNGNRPGTVIARFISPRNETLASLIFSPNSIRIRLQIGPPQLHLSEHEILAWNRSFFESAVNDLTFLAPRGQAALQQRLAELLRIDRSGVRWTEAGTAAYDGSIGGGGATFQVYPNELTVRLIRRMMDYRMAMRW